MSEKLTQSELFQMFGGEIPMEAVTLIFDGPGDMTIGECREKLKAMAEARKPKPAGEMVERVAEAIRATQAMPHTKEQVARAAIEAMREPTETMRKAGYALTVDDEVEIWQGMIDEALK